MIPCRNMSNNDYSEIERDLDILLQAFPDPLKLSTELETFLDHPVTKQFITGGDEPVKRLVLFLQECHEPSLAMVAVIILSRFPATLFYTDLLEFLGKSDQHMTMAIETGLWMIELEERQIAEDLINVVTSSGNPYPLLLLQRPAAQTVSVQLAEFIRQHQIPLSLYALYCYRYVMPSQDTMLLIEVSNWDEPEMSALAGLYLLKLSRKESLQGINRGLMAKDEQVRIMTYRELAAYLPEEVFNQTNYDPKKEPNLQMTAVNHLLQELVFKFNSTVR